MKDALLPHGFGTVEEFCQSIQQQKNEELAEKIPLVTKVSLLMIKKQVYEDMLAWFSNTKTPVIGGGVKTMKEDIAQEYVELAYLSHDDTTDLPVFARHTNIMGLNRIKSLFNHNVWSTPDEGYSQEQCDIITDVILTRDMFNYLRKSPTPDVMAGSQSENLDGILFLASVAIKEAERVEQKRKADGWYDDE